MGNPCIVPPTSHMVCHSRFLGFLVVARVVAIFVNVMFSFLFQRKFITKIESENLHRHPHSPTNIPFSSPHITQAWAEQDAHASTHPHTQINTFTIIHHMMRIELCWMMVCDWCGGGGVVALRKHFFICWLGGPQRRRAAQGNNATAIPPNHPPPSNITLSTSSDVLLV